MTDNRVIIRESLIQTQEDGTAKTISEATCANFAPHMVAAIEWCKYRMRKEYPTQLDAKVVIQWVIDDDRERDVRVYIRVFVDELTHVFTLIPRDRMSIHKMGKLKLRSLVVASTLKPGAAFTPDVIDEYPNLWISDNTLRIFNRVRNTEAQQ